MVYLHDDRARARSAVSRLTNLATEAKRAAERGLLLPDVTEAAIVQLTQTTERSRQVDALSMLADRLQKQHLDKLLPLAANEFNAFCEYVNPDEAPASAWHLWLTEKLQQIEFDPELDRFILNCPPGHAKPLHVDTPVLMANGTWKRLGDIVVGDKVLSDIGCARDVEAVHAQGVLPLLKITTVKGRVVYSAPDHPFHVIKGQNNYSWTLASNLRPGDELRITGRPHNIDKQIDRSNRSEDEFTLAAFYAAFGGYTRSHRKTSAGNLTGNHNFQMWFADLGHADTIKPVLDRLGIRYASRWVEANGRHLLRLRSKDARTYHDILCLDQRAAERRIPDWVFKGSDAKVKHYLSTFLKLRGDTPNHYTSATLVCHLLSEGYVRDLQRLFARFGVDAETVMPTTPTGMFTLKIAGGAIETLLEQGIKFIGWPYPEFAKKRLKFGTDVTDAVATIEPAGEGECKCLTVKSCQTFLADGIVVHNSTYASRLFVAWRLGRNPDLKIIGGGHSQRFVENEFSSKIRNLVGSPDYKRVFPEVLVDYATRAKDQWAIAGKNGFYAAKGVGQAVHGFRANFVCVDDPYAKIEEAESAVQREKVNTWFVGDLGSRMLPFGKMFLIMTRFHEEDLTGYLMEMNKRLPAYARWHQTEAPALCIDPETDVLGRKLGEVLWDYYDLAYFVAKKTEWSFQRFSLVYQQNAAATSEDNVSGQFKFYHTLPHLTEEALKAAREAGQIDEAGRVQPNRRAYFRRIVLSVDCAAKVNQRADYTVVQTWGETHDRKHYLLRQTRVKVEFDKMIEVIEKQAIKDKVDTILVEDKGQGTAYIQNRGTTNAHRRLAPAPIIGIDPKGQSKEFRFDEVTPLITAGEVYLPEKAEWIDALIKEVGQFPDGAHDDQVDAMTQYLQWAKSTRTRFGTKKISSMG
jgi:predicted phage terminase large subunit-like protein